MNKEAKYWVLNPISNKSLRLNVFELNTIFYRYYQVQMFTKLDINNDK